MHNIMCKLKTTNWAIKQSPVFFLIPPSIPLDQKMTFPLRLHALAFFTLKT